MEVVKHAKFEDRINYISALHLIARTRFKKRGVDQLLDSAFDVQAYNQLVLTCNNHVDFWQPYNLAKGAWTVGRMRKYPRIICLCVVLSSNTCTRILLSLI
jgi:hypothetical protein